MIGTMVKAKGTRQKAQVRNALSFVNLIMRWATASSFLTVAFCLLPFALTGCGYSLAGRGSFLPDYIKVIAVPQFVNQTVVFDLDREISEKVRTEFASHGRYQVTTDPAGADAIVTGILKNSSLLVTATTNNVASRYAVIITASVEFKDVKADKVLWSSPSMQFREEYDAQSGSAAVTTDVAAFLAQQQGALTRLAQSFAKSTVTSILEAF
jgi:hypothetical protein